MTRRAKLALVCAGLSWLATAAPGCGRRVVDPAPPVPVETVVLRREAAQRHLRFAATVRERQRIELSFKVPGTVAGFLPVREPNGESRDVQEGDRIDCQHPLAVLDDADYARRLATARERLGQAEARERAVFAQLNGARTDYERLRSLRGSNAVSAQDHDDALARRNSIEAEWEAAQREVSAAKVALQQAEDDWKNCRLFSPLPGATVSRKYVEVNERVVAGQPAVEIMDLSQVRVAFGAPDVRLREFHAGQELTILADALPGESFTGRVSKIQPAADLKTRTFEVEVTIDPPRGLKPGMVVTLLLGHPDEMTLLPMSAVQRGDTADDYSVFVASREAGRDVARRRRIRFDGVYDNRLRVVEGADCDVRLGDAVIVSGADRLVDGQPVRVQRQFEPAWQAILAHEI